jgi:hypothetical protein
MLSIRQMSLSSVSSAHGMIPSADHRKALAIDGQRFYFVPRIEHMFYRGTALYHTMRRSALGLELD